jgi:hypothetical protein
MITSVVITAICANWVKTSGIAKVTNATVSTRQAFHRDGAAATGELEGDVTGSVTVIGHFNGRMAKGAKKKARVKKP